MTGGEHARMRVASGGEAVAALATTRGQDRATRTGAHAQSETVGLVTTTVVRLEGALAQRNSLHSRGLEKTDRCRVVRRDVASWMSQLAPPIHEISRSGNCHGHAAPVDTGFDLPTVRAASGQGQTERTLPDSDVTGSVPRVVHSSVRAPATSTRSVTRRDRVSGDDTPRYPQAAPRWAPCLWRTG
jgi:hypothetical protein